MDEQSKISLPETIIMTMFSLLGELLDVIAMGWIIGFPIQFWLFFKGRGVPFKKQAPSLIGNIIEIIPLFNLLPIRTVTLLISIYLINHPEKSNLLGGLPGKASVK